MFTIFKWLVWFVLYDTRAEISFEPYDYSKVELPEELLASFAKAMTGEIRKFYDSDFGKDYFHRWLEKHPEYA